MEEKKILNSKNNNQTKINQHGAIWLQVQNKMTKTFVFRSKDVMCGVRMDKRERCIYTKFKIVTEKRKFRFEHFVNVVIGQRKKLKLKFNEKY
jgi:hypothetical protein